MTDVAGKKFTSLEKKYQNRIYDFDLSIVYIDQKLNPDFDQVDHFVRLNNKPYPIKNDSFEMWNSYMNKDIIERIKKLNQAHEEWFYYRVNNKRRVNEELLTAFTYLEYVEQYQEDTTLFDQISIYQYSNSINIRIKSRDSITRFLKLSINLEEETIRQDTLKSIRKVEDVIQKLEELLTPNDIIPENKNEYLKRELDNLFNTENAIYRAQKNLYIIWLILTKIDQSQIAKRKADLKKDIESFFQYFGKVFHQNLSSENEADITETFKNKVESIWNNYSDNTVQKSA